MSKKEMKKESAPKQSDPETAAQGQTLEQRQEGVKKLESSQVKKTSQPAAIMRLNGRALKTSLDLPFLKQRHPDFSVGDTIRVNVRIQEGDKKRIQVYEGIVIAMRGEGNGRSFIVRRVSHEVGVERIFPYYSPVIQSIEVVRKGRVRRARLYYLREKSGKEGRIQESFAYIAEKIEKEKELEKQAEESESPIPIDDKKKRLSKKEPQKASKKSAEKISKQSSRKIVKVSKTAAKKMTKKAFATTKKKTAKKASKKTSKSKAKSKKKKK